MKLVFATNNQNKLKEVQAQLPKEIELLSLEDIGCFEDIPETAPTIEENALQKAVYLKENYGYDCFADDTGLEVEVLNGAPGVYSARYAGESKDSAENIKKLLFELQGKENRNARFKTVISLIINNKNYNFTGICQGKIIESLKGSQGFGYDPVFQPEGYDITFAEMDLTLKSTISHRGIAVKKLIDFLQK